MNETGKYAALPLILQFFRIIRHIRYPTCYQPSLFWMIGTVLYIISEESW